MLQLMRMTLFVQMDSLILVLLLLMKNNRFFVIGW